MTKSFIFFLIIALLNTANASSVIRQYCSEARSISLVSSPQDLVKASCDIGEVFSAEPNILSLTQQIIKLTKSLRASSEWKNNNKLNDSLEKLSEALNQAPKKATSPHTTPLALALNEIATKWHDSKMRSAHHADYIKDFNQVLAMTNTGRQVLDCYQKAQDPLITGEQIEQISEEQKANGVSMAFTLLEDQKSPGKYVKTILFDEDTSPMTALFLYAHEMKHGCNSKISVKIFQYMDTHNSSNTPRREIALEKEKNDQLMAIDEMRAYKINVELFKEMAQAAPEVVCNEYYVSNIFGKQIISSAEYNAKMDEMIEDGTYPLHLISQYAVDGAYWPENVLKSDDNGWATHELRLDLIKKLEAEGIHVKK
jgi:hypothetical protein